MTEIARRLVDDPILPINCVDDGEKLKEDTKVFKRAHAQLFSDNGIDLSKCLTRIGACIFYHIYSRVIEFTAIQSEICDQYIRQKE